MIGIDVGWGVAWYALDPPIDENTSYEFYVDNRLMRRGTCSSERVNECFVKFCFEMHRITLSVRKAQGIVNLDII